MRVIYDLFRDGLSAINDAADRLAVARQQVATGRRVAGASDDPMAVRQAVSEHATLGAIDAYRRSSDSASARLSAADNVLSSVIDKIQAALVAGASARGSSVSAAARAAAADTVRGLHDSLVTDLNATFNGHSVFAGTATGAPAFAEVGGAWTYQGNSDVTRVEVERGQLVAVSLDGQQIVQGDDTVGLFDGLDDLAAAIGAGDHAAIGAAMSALDRAFDRAQRAQSRLGTDERLVDAASARLTTLRSSTEARRSKLEDVNFAEAAVRLAEADTAYRAALGAVSTAERQSLLDYLR